MTEPWSRRPQAPRGDSSPDSIFCGVGRALTMWEIIESQISIAYIGLIDSKEYRANKYFSTASFARRHALVKNVIETNVSEKDCSGFGEFMETALKYSHRRHEIAHGQVLNLGEYGFYLCPNTTLTRNFPDYTAA